VPSDPITTYATVADLSLYAVSEEALSGIDPEKVTGALEAAARLADGYLASQYILPLTTVPTELRMQVAVMAAWILVTTAGINPEGTDQVFAERNAAALKWLEGIGRGAIRPVGMTGSGIDEVGGQPPGARPAVISATPRGFSSRGGGPGGGFVGD